MKLENQVCSLELAKKIKQLGVKQDSLWWWMKYQRMPDSSIFWTIQREEIKDTNEYSFIKRDNISAFTVSECLRIYDEEITIPKGFENVANFIAEKIVDKYSA